MKIKGIIYTVISAFMYGFTPALTGITYNMGNNGLSMAFYRNLFAIPILLLLIKRSNMDFKVEKYQLKNIAAVAVFGSTATVVLLYSSYSFVGVGTATTLHFLYPLFVSLLCKYVFNEKLGKRKVITLIFACTGILFFIDIKHAGNILGVLMAVASSFTYAFYMVWMEKKRLVRINPYKLSFYFAIFAVAALLIGNLFFGYIKLNLPFVVYVLMFIVSMCTSFLATILLQLGIKEIGSSSSAIFSLFEPITSVIVGALLLEEKVTLYKITGCIIIFLSITYLALMNKGSSDVE